MDIEILLYKVYKRRKIMADAFAVVCSVIAGLFIVLFFKDGIIAVRDMISGNATEIKFAQLRAWLFAGVGFELLIPVYFCGSIKRELKKAKPKIDYMNNCIAKLDIKRQDTIKSEAADFFRGFTSRTRIDFGRDCLYGRTVSNHWKDISYDVILPYEKIKQVILPEFFKKDLNQKLSEAASIASVVISAVGLLAGVGGVLVWSTNHALFLIVDHSDNYHLMSCGANSFKANETITRYVEQILERSPDVQIGYIAKS